MAAIISEAFFTAWLVETAPAPAPTLRIYEERSGVRPAIVARIARRVVEDYVGVETLLKAGGFVRAAALVRSSLPDNKRTRSGDLGEIVASQYIDSETSFRVPVPKLQWKSDRQMPMHGNDVIAIAWDDTRALGWRRGPLTHNSLVGFAFRHPFATFSCGPHHFPVQRLALLGLTRVSFP